MEIAICLLGAIIVGMNIVLVFITRRLGTYDGTEISMLKRFHNNDKNIVSLIEDVASHKIYIDCLETRIMRLERDAETATVSTAKNYKDMKEIIVEVRTIARTNIEQFAMIGNAIKDLHRKIKEKPGKVEGPGSLVLTEGKPSLKKKSKSVAKSTTRKVGKKK